MVSHTTHDKISVRDDFSTMRVSQRYFVDRLWMEIYVCLSMFDLCELYMYVSSSGLLLCKTDIHSDEFLGECMIYKPELLALVVKSL